MNARTEHRTTQPWMGTVGGLPRIENRRVEDYGNIVISSKGTPWEYQPRGPFQFQHWHQSSDPALCGWAVCATLADAVNEFARWALPPREGYMAEIVDESFRQIVAGVWTTDTRYTTRAAWDLGGAWFGCRAAFDEFRRQHVCDDVSIAMWEVTAMRTAPGSGMVE